MTDHDPMDDAVRRALAREAESVRPDEDGLTWIRNRIRAEAPTRSRRPWFLAAAAAVAATVAVAGVVTVLGRGAETQTSAPGSVEAGAGDARQDEPSTPGPERVTPSQEPSRPPGTPATKVPPPAAARTVPVYWLGTQVGRPDLPPRLYRTFVKVTDDPGSGAVAAMTTQAPGDPDYRSAWRGAKLSSVQHTGGSITVDFDTLPTARLGAAEAKVAVQSLVYTVQGALGVTDAVRITLGGQPAPPLFGQVDARAPIRRAPTADVQAMVWVTSPTEGATASSPVRVTGIAAAFEATVNWQVLDASTKAVVRSGFTNAEEGMKHSPFAFSVPLPAGRYVIHCYEASAQDGRTTFSDTKTITVR